MTAQFRLSAPAAVRRALSLTARRIVVFAVPGGQYVYVNKAALTQMREREPGLTRPAICQMRVADLTTAETAKHWLMEAERCLFMNRAVSYIEEYGRDADGFLQLLSPDAPVAPEARVLVHVEILPVLETYVMRVTTPIQPLLAAVAEYLAQHGDTVVAKEKAPEGA